MKRDPYEDLRWSPGTNGGLAFDDRYRLAQLPLVRPDHPRAIHHQVGSDYRSGRYDRARTSLVADLGSDFFESEACQHFLRRIAELSFQEKIATHLLQRRVPVLHATLVGDVDLDAVTRAAVRERLTDVAPLRPTVHGPFVGRFNVGRIYLPLEFSEPSDRQLIRDLNAVVERTPPRLIAVGLVNLSHELTAAEAGELAGLIRDMAGPLSSWRVTQLSWMTTHDDLTLDADRVETITLGAPSTGSDPTES